jgi:hypothetical protein
MNIHIHRQQRDSTTVQEEQIASGIQHALGDLATRIDDVTIHLRAAHSSSGDAHIHCRMLAALPISQIVIAESFHADEAEAIARASMQLARAVQDQFAAHDQPIARAPVTNRIAATTLFRRRTSLTTLTTERQSQAAQLHHFST